MSYRLINANDLNGVISDADYEKVLNMPCVFADLPNGMDGKHYDLQSNSDGDCISRSHFDERVRVAGGMVEYEVSDDFKEGVLTVLEMLKTEPPIQPKVKWIPVTTRPLTDEEKEIHGEWEFMYDCSLPESGQDVLITDCYGNVEVDSFYNDGEYGCYFENNCDDDEVIAWMPLPKPYEVDKE